jgi:glycosyltransferase involved in cell wall biosynthesis
MFVGIDLEQFVTDPYGSGIQRVLQYLAKEWPAGDLHAEFVVPWQGGHALLSPAEAEAMLTIPFTPRDPDDDLRDLVLAHIAGLERPVVTSSELLTMFDAWLLAEVSYLPPVLRRMEDFAARVPTTMVGYDTLPMFEPANYRFRPGTAPWVSEYFRLLATAASVVCISDTARQGIVGRLRRDSARPTSVAHPGGDHIDVRTPQPSDRPVFARLGTLEARKRPVEIVEAFREARDSYGLEADLLFIGGHNASTEGINRTIRAQVDLGGVRWVHGASDAEVRDLVHTSSAFLSIGVEGYGIPVLEAVRLGTPVLFDGVQPAAELMAGAGARRVPAMGHEDLVALFRHFADPEALAGLRAELEPERVPTWRDFATGVAEAVGNS